MRIKKLGLLGLALVLALALTGAGFAYFTDVETSSGNIAQAGTLDMQIKKEGGGWQNGSPVSEAWISPEGWAPGEEFTTDPIWLRNVGSIDAKWVFLRFASLSCDNGDDPEPEGSGTVCDLSTKIALAKIEEYRTGLGWYCSTEFDEDTANSWLNYWVVTPKGYISLWDLVYLGNPKGGSALTCMYIGPGSGDCGYDPDVYPMLPADSSIEAGVKMTFKLMEDTKNEYQGDRCTFSVDFIAAQTLDDLDESITEDLSPLSG